MSSYTNTKKDNSGKSASLGPGHVVESKKKNAACPHLHRITGDKREILKTTISVHVKILSLHDYRCYCAVYTSTVMLLSVYLNFEVLLQMIWLLWEENDL